MDFDWNDIPLLRALAQTGSMAQTARNLGLVTSTVSRRLAAAEDALGVRLFIRDPTGYKATESGRVFLAHADRIVDRVETMFLEARAEQEDIAGPVNITGIDVVLSHWLAEHVPSLMERHPRLEINLLGDMREYSFTRRETDLALRLNRPSADAALRMRKVGELGFAVYGAAAFAGATRKEWASLTWLSFPAEMSWLPEMQWLAKIGPQRFLRFSSIAMLARACERGLGIALLPCVVGRRLGLTRLQDGIESKRELWLLSHKDAAQVARFRAVADWLKAAADQDAELLAGP
ncbi:LysR family transcriptional regulator [Pseudoxanthomonas sp. Root630]|uniref:LysR family transcriptional regulator n=1 Tax=Pseudoxanthomonas sp. Root630 TaxID=1736574 RepID=UPI000703A1B6|nr:LysR family transcriptional regulator [Pseudoxanthomonas sp. Root630]KRA46952.1 LysR family transcriptional regulator [Pseudoxanthomonas sp. Root630]